MDRKIVQLFPVAQNDASGVTLYAVADDGTAWALRQSSDGAFADAGWQQIASLPKKDTPDPLSDLG